MGTIICRSRPLTNAGEGPWFARLPCLLGGEPWGKLGRAVLVFHLTVGPLLFSPWTLQAFEDPKAALLVGTALVLAALGLSGLMQHWVSSVEGAATVACRGGTGRLLKGRPVPPRQATDAAGARRREGTLAVKVGVLLLVLSAVASTVGSISPRTSLLGAQDSNAGLGTVLAQVILFLATWALCRGVGDARRLLAAAVLAAGLSASYALVQFAGLDPVPWEGVSTYGTLVRPFGTLGHANHLGGFLVMTFPLTVYLGHRALQKRRWAAATVLTLVGALTWLGVLISISRAAWLALACAFGVLALGWLRPGALRRLAAAASVLPLLTAGLVLTLPCWGRPDALAGILERVGRLGESASRQQIWWTGLAIFRDAPLLGCGLDTFQLAFAAHRTPAYWELEWNFTPTRAHNEAVHVLATQGLVGAAALLTLLVGLVLAGRRAWVRAREADRPLLLALFAAFLGFVIQSLFSFTQVSCGSLVVTLAALVCRLGEAERDRGRTRDEGRRTSGAVLLSARLVQAGVWVSAAVLLWSLVVRPMQANMACRAGSALLEEDPERAMPHLARAAALDPLRDFYQTRLSDAAEVAAQRASSPAERERWLALIRQALERSRELVPVNAYTHNNLGNLLGRLAREGRAPAAQAFAAFDRAITLDRANVYFYQDAAEAALGLGDHVRAEAYAGRALALYPHFGPARAQLGYLALVRQRPEAARDLLQAAVVGEWRGSATALTIAWANLACACRDLSRHEEAVAAARTALQQSPGFSEARLVCARSLEELGRREEAVAEYRHILAHSPEHGAARDALARLAGGRVDPPVEGRER